MDTPLGAVLEIVVFLGIIFVLFILPVILSSGVAPYGSTDDGSAELEAQDAEMRRQAEDYEREQRAKEAQEEYEDYLEWVNSGRP